MPSIATVLKQKALQSYGGAPSIAAVLSGKLFKVTAAVEESAFYSYRA